MTKLLEAVAQDRDGYCLAVNTVMIKEDEPLEVLQLIQQHTLESWNRQLDENGQELVDLSRITWQVRELGDPTDGLERWR